MLETKAPDEAVIRANPDCARTPQGKPTRRAKIHYFLVRKGLQSDALEEFVLQDIENITQLFDLFNEGTHGPAGTFELQKLLSMRKRVEGGILFLAKVAN